MPQDNANKTKVTLKDGTVLYLKGTNLSDEAIQAGIQRYRTWAVSNPAPAAPQGNSASPSTQPPAQQPPSLGQRVLNGAEEQSSVPFSLSMIHPLDGIAYMMEHPIDSASLIYHAMANQSAQTMAEGRATAAQPGFMNKLVGGTQQDLSLLPGAGPAINAMGKHAAKGEYAEMAGGVGMFALQGELMGKGPGLVGDAAERGFAAYRPSALEPGSPHNLVLQGHIMQDQAQLSEQGKVMNAVGKINSEVGEQYRAVSTADKSAATASQAAHPSQPLQPLYDIINKSTDTYRPATAAAKTPVTAANPAAGPSALTGIISDMNKLNDPSRIDPILQAPAASHIWWDELKDLRTNIRVAMHGASPRDMAILTNLHGTATDMMQAGADKVGQLDNFTAANDTTRQLWQHRDSVLDTLTNPSTQPGAGHQFYNDARSMVNTPQFSAATKFLADRGGYDPTSIPEMLKNFKTTHGAIDVLDKSDPSIMGKFRSMATHPLMAIPAAASVYMLPLPQGMKFVAAMLAAGKAATLSDRWSLAGEIRRLGVDPAEGANMLSADDVRPSIQRLQIQKQQMQQQAQQVSQSVQPGAGQSLLSRIVGKISQPSDTEQLSNQLDQLKQDNENFLQKGPGDMPPNGTGGPVTPPQGNSGSQGGQSE